MPYPAKLATGFHYGVEGDAGGEGGREKDRKSSLGPRAPDVGCASDETRGISL